MKINAAFSNLKELDFLIKNGADEVYCGLLTDSEKEGMTNHRPNLPAMNLRTLDELKESIQICHDNSKKIAFVINEVGYFDKFLKPILEKLQKIDKMGIDAFVVSDINLMNILKNTSPYNRIKAKKYLSSIAPVFNMETFNFYKNFGISRIVLPQHLYPIEFAQLKNKISIETEVFFFKTNYCRCIDGNCFYTYNYQIWKDKMHLDACDHVWGLTKFDLQHKKGSLKDNIAASILYEYPFGLNPYGAVYDFYKLGVNVIKLGNREQPFSIKKKCLKLTKFMLNKLADETMTRSKFISLCRLKSLSMFY